MEVRRRDGGSSDANRRATSRLKDSPFYEDTIFLKSALTELDAARRRPPAPAAICIPAPRDGASPMAPAAHLQR